MNKKALVFAVAAACLTSGAAFAQSYDYGSDRNDGDQRSTRYERNDNDSRYYRYGRNDRDNRQYGERRDYSGDYNRNDGYNRDGYNRDGYSRDYRYNGYSASAYRSNDYYGQQRYRMQRGERLSQYYRGDQYVVSDWRRHRGLYAPQYGYQWVQAGNDYALVAIATGIIASVLLNH